MLYQIKNKSGVILGVHESAPNKIRDYLTTLPRQQAPHSARELPVTRRRAHTFAANAIQGWSFSRGFVAGVTFSSAVFAALHFAGVL